MVKKISIKLKQITMAYQEHQGNLADLEWTLMGVARLPVKHAYSRDGQKAPLRAYLRGSRLDGDGRYIPEEYAVIQNPIEFSQGQEPEPLAVSFMSDEQIECFRQKVREALNSNYRYGIVTTESS